MPRRADPARRAVRVALTTQNAEESPPARRAAPRPRAVPRASSVKLRLRNKLLQCRAVPRRARAPSRAGDTKRPEWEPVNARAPCPAAPIPRAVPRASFSHPRTWNSRRPRALPRRADPARRDARAQSSEFEKNVAVPCRAAPRRAVPACRAAHVVHKRGATQFSPAWRAAPSPRAVPARRVFNQECETVAAGVPCRAAPRPRAVPRASCS